MVSWVCVYSTCDGSLPEPTCLDCCDTDGFVVACTHSWKISALPQSRAVVLLALLAAISGLWLESTMARGEDPSAAVHLRPTVGGFCTKAHKGQA